LVEVQSGFVPELTAAVGDAALVFSGIPTSMARTKAKERTRRMVAKPMPDNLDFAFMTFGICT